MNKIVLDDVRVLDSSVDDCISFCYDSNDLGIMSLNIDVLKSCDLFLKYDFNDSKVEVSVNVSSNVSLNVFEIVNGCSAKVRTQYSILDDSHVVVSKFNNVDSIKEYFVSNLDGCRSSISYNLKTISVNPLSYDFLVYHNCKDSVSNIVTNGVSILDGSILFNVSSFIPSGITGCVASQDNKIINLNEHLCVIKPNLYIDCDDVIANHSAWVGSFKDDLLFYLQSRGICYDDAMRLLVRGFLTSGLGSDLDFSKEVLDIIDNYWR